MSAAFGSRSALILLVCLCSTTQLPGQRAVCPIQKAPDGPAAQALAHEDYATAATLFAATAKSNPGDMSAVAGEIRSLIGEQQVSAAADLAEKSLAAHPDSSVLQTSLGEVRFRQGRLADAFQALQHSLAMDPCLPRTRYVIYRLMWIESMHKSAYEQLQAANQLEPDDPSIHLAWVEHLPLAARVRGIDAYLAAGNGGSSENKEKMQRYTGRLRAILAAKNRGCRLTASSPAATTLPFSYVMRDPHHFNGVGFDVKVNDKAKALLELDTGAYGILLNRATARKAGLAPIAHDSISGLGDQKSLDTYWAFADDLKIGTLEFQNCIVEVSDKRSLVDSQGLIGADVFENYRVKLDFPLRQMTLSPLPAPPGNIGQAPASLNVSGIGNAAAAAAGPPHPDNGSGAQNAQATIHYTDRYISPEMKSWSPFARFGHQILIDGYLKDKQPRLFLLDSGAYSSVLSIAAGKSVGKIHADSYHHAVGVNGAIKHIFRADKADIVFAGLRYPLRDALIMDLDILSKSDGTEVSGIVGLDALTLLTVDIDYRDGLVHLSFDPEHGKDIIAGPTR